MALPRHAMGLSGVCDCGIFLILFTYYYRPGQSKDPLINAYNSMQSESSYYSNDNVNKFPVHYKVFSTGPCQFNLFATYTVSPRLKVIEL